MALSKEQEIRREIRKNMIADGFSEYDSFHNITKESSELWNKEFIKRYNAYKNNSNKKIKK